MRRCEVQDRIDEWPYSRRCTQEAARTITICYAATTMTTHMYGKETLRVCGEHRTRAEEAGVILADHALEKP